MLADISTQKSNTDFIWIPSLYVRVNLLSKHSRGLNKPRELKFSLLSFLLFLFHLKHYLEIESLAAHILIEPARTFYLLIIESSKEKT